MRTIARRTVTTLSLLLLLAAAGTWARAQWATEAVGHAWPIGTADAPGVRFVGLQANTGSIGLRVGTTSPLAGTPGAAPAFLRQFGRLSGLNRQTAPPRAIGPAGGAAGRWGFGLETRDSTGATPAGGQQLGLQSRFTEARAPWWFLTLLFAIAPALALRRWHKARRGKPGHCPHCGYDLRATAQPAGRLRPTCPGCGSP